MLHDTSHPILSTSTRKKTSSILILPTANQHKRYVQQIYFT